jgi:hypothetical protein
MQLSSRFGTCFILSFSLTQVADVFANLDKSDLGKISKQNFMEGLQEFAASNGVSDFSELADSFDTPDYDKTPTLITAVSDE